MPSSPLAILSSSSSHPPSSPSSIKFFLPPLTRYSVRHQTTLHPHSQAAAAAATASLLTLEQWTRIIKNKPAACYHPVLAQERQVKLLYTEDIQITNETLRASYSAHTLWQESMKQHKSPLILTLQQQELTSGLNSIDPALTRHWASGAKQQRL